MTQEIFIIGTGRSGTHYVTKVINSFENVYDPFKGEENRIDLRIARARAIKNRQTINPVNIAMHKSYSIIARSKGMHYLNQTHPNLFFYEHLSRVFPKAKFVAVMRPELQVVASMMAHSGVTREILRSDLHKFPNQFLGDINQGSYEKLSTIEKFALRVVAHYNAINHISDRENVMVVNYEDFFLDYRQSYEGLAKFLGINKFDYQQGPAFKADSLGKWKGVISEKDNTEIEDIVRKWGQYR
jgi:hypothetical protein